MNVPDVSGDDSLGFLSESWIACHLYGNTRVNWLEEKKEEQNNDQRNISIFNNLGDLLCKYCKYYC